MLKEYKEVFPTELPKTVPPKLTDLAMKCTNFSVARYCTCIIKNIIVTHKITVIKKLLEE